MFHFAQTSTYQAINLKAWFVRLTAACLLVVMVATQLFTYETFVSVFHVGDWDGVVAAWIVTMEVAALPYLLSMRLSTRARFVSKVAGWSAALVWIILSVVMPAGINSGFFGTVITVSGGFPVGGMTTLLSIMIVVSTMYERRP